MANTVSRAALLVVCVAVAAFAFTLAAGVAPSDRPPVATPAAAGDWQRVEVTALGDPSDVVAYIEGLGGVIELRSHQRVQARLHESRMLELSNARQLLRVEPPAQAVPLQLPTALSLIGVDRWRAAGFTGHEVRVAILDAGFDGYEDALDNTLPSQVVTRSFRGDGAIDAGSDHGTRAAEIVHSVAPGAELYLVNFGTITELSAAVDYLVEQEVGIVSFSLGFIHNGPGDGTGPVDEIVSRSVGAGTLWTVAAGNWSQQHWTGTFTDDDQDSVHEFTSSLQQNSREFSAGDLIIVSLRWDDTWGAACSDYDLELFGPNGSLVRASRHSQDCTGNPVEGMQILAAQSGRYGVRIVRASDDVSRRLDLMLVGSPGRGEALDIFSVGGSLSEPADHPLVLTVGAVSALDPGVVASFSSRGPTVDGRTKPDVLSPAGLAGAVEGGASFAGTSAAAPHVAGLAAMLREAFPSASARDLRVVVSERAVDIIEGGDGAAEGAMSALANLGSLANLGALLPAGADESVLVGGLPPGEGFAPFIYLGPDGYPLRFAHLLVDERRPLAWFNFAVQTQQWLSFFPNAPAFVNSLESVEHGALLFGWFDAPATSGDVAASEEDGAVGIDETQQ